MSNEVVALPAAYLRGVFVISGVESLKILRDPTELLTRAIQPALWLLIFGQAFTRLRIVPTGSSDYLSFLAPGILAQSVTFVAIFYGISIIWERDLGILQKYLATPVPRSALIVGKLLSAGFRAVIQGLIVLILSLVLGAQLNWNIFYLMGVLVVTILGAALFAGLSMVIASIVKTRERMMGIGQLITMPLFFASNALYPLSMMPDWLKVVASFNPMSYLVDALRSLLIVGYAGDLIVDALVLVGTTILLAVLSTILYPRLAA